MKINFFLSILFSFSIIFGQDCPISNEELVSLYNKIKSYQYSDSTNAAIIDNLYAQIEDYRNITKNDSLIIEYQKLELGLKDKLIQQVKPKWYENKYIYWVYGAGTVMISSWVVSNVK